MKLNILGETETKQHLLNCPNKECNYQIVVWAKKNGEVKRVSGAEHVFLLQSYKKDDKVVELNPPLSEEDIKGNPKLYKEIISGGNKNNIWVNGFSCNNCKSVFFIDVEGNTPKKSDVDDVIAVIEEAERKLEPKHADSCGCIHIPLYLGDRHRKEDELKQSN